MLKRLYFEILLFQLFSLGLVRNRDLSYKTEENKEMFLFSVVLIKLFQARPHNFSPITLAVSHM